MTEIKKEGIWVKCPKCGHKWITEKTSEKIICPNCNKRVYQQTLLTKNNLGRIKRMIKKIEKTLDNGPLPFEWQEELEIFRKGLLEAEKYIESKCF